MIKQTLKIKNICIGEGIPKICAPIVGRTREDILMQVRTLKEIQPDLVEWRVDWYDDVEKIDAVLLTLKEIADIIGEYPLIFTFRTKQEGGEKQISFEDYSDLILQAAKSGYIDIVDLELFITDNLEELIQELKKESVAVIVSSHDFKKTPSRAELLLRLQKMDTIGADILKIAVMPHNNKDVLTLLEVTNEMKDLHTRKPMITMAMEKVGVISRITGEIFGSDITFGAAGQASAPGQITVNHLRKMLKDIHEVIN